MNKLTQPIHIKSAILEQGLGTIRYPFYFAVISLVILILDRIVLSTDERALDWTLEHFLLPLAVLNFALGFYGYRKWVRTKGVSMIHLRSSLLVGVLVNLVITLITSFTSVGYVNIINAVWPSRQGTEYDGVVIQKRVSQTSKQRKTYYLGIQVNGGGIEMRVSKGMFNDHAIRESYRNKLRLGGLGFYYHWNFNP